MDVDSEDLDLSLRISVVPDLCGLELCLFEKESDSGVFLWNYEKMYSLYPPICSLGRNPFAAMRLSLRLQRCKGVDFCLPGTSVPLLAHATCPFPPCQGGTPSPSFPFGPSMANCVVLLLRALLGLGGLVARIPDWCFLHVALTLNLVIATRGEQIQDCQLVLFCTHAILKIIFSQYP